MQSEVVIKRKEREISLPIRIKGKYLNPKVTLYIDVYLSNVSSYFCFYYNRYSVPSLEIGHFDSFIGIKLGREGACSSVMFMLFRFVMLVSFWHSIHTGKWAFVYLFRLMDRLIWLAPTLCIRSILGRAVWGMMNMMMHFSEITFGAIVWCAGCI